MRFYYTPIRMIIIWSSNDINYWQGCTKKWITHTLLVENILIVSYKTKHAVTTRSSNCTLGQLSQKIKTYILSLYKNLYMNIHSSFIHNCPKLKTTQMSFSGWMVKLTMAHLYIGIQPSIRRNSLLTHAKTWMDIKGIVVVV